MRLRRVLGPASIIYVKQRLPEETLPDIFWCIAYHTPRLAPIELIYPILVSSRTVTSHSLNRPCMCELSALLVLIFGIAAKSSTGAQF